jgi:molecular chaperone HtpG
MGKEQKDIYYASGKSLDAIKLLPQLEKYKKDNLDVLYFDKDIDEFAAMMMHDYDQHAFVNIASDSKDNLSKEEQDKLASLTTANQRILDDIKESLKGKVDDVAFSSKLVDSPVCIATKEGLSLNMENVLDEQQEKTQAEGEKPKASKVLEINPDHDLWKAIASVGNDDEKAKRYGALLYDEAMMLEGYEVKDKSAFVKNLNDLMLEALKK